MNDLIITTIQADLQWEDKSKNLKMFDAYLENIEKSDIIVLPEMFNTGFSMNADVLAESMNDATVQWMCNTSARLDSAICGSLIIKENGKYYNRLLFVEPSGKISSYDKIHLFSMGDEHKYFSAGSKNLQLEYKGWKINPIVCYDLRFNEGIRNTSTDPYDVIIVVANWPEKRIEHWDVLLKARAIENQCYVVGVNRTGEDGNNIFHSGHSQIVHPFGNLLYFSEESEINTITLSRQDLVFNRRAFPFIKDIV